MKFDWQPRIWSLKKKFIVYVLGIWMVIGLASIIFTAEENSVAETTQDSELKKY